MREAAVYTARARDGVQRLRNILDAMSEANRVEELMRNAEPEVFDLRAALAAARDAYADAWPDRSIRLDAAAEELRLSAAPELIMQMLDKLIDNAVGFSGKGDEIVLSLARDGNDCCIAVFNPGPPLPESMRAQLFDSMVSVRDSNPDKHLGLGLYVARIIAEGHNGNIDAENVDNGVRFTVRLPAPIAADTGR